MDFREFVKENIVVMDGGMGTQLQAAGMLPGEFPERWNITHPEVIITIQRNYFDSGTNLINTNTFGANSLKFEDEELDEIIKAAIHNAKQARDNSLGPQPKFISLDIGPCGKLLKPYGDLDFEDAVAIFSKIVNIGVKYGVDTITIETMNDSYETKAALLAAKENSDLPVLVSNAYGKDGKLMTGASPKAMVAMLEGMGADAIGVNCSLGPDLLEPVVDEYLKYASVPVICKPNAGLPSVREGITCYDLDAKTFADQVAKMVQKGVRIAGGCCGTTPEYIENLKAKVKGLSPKKIIKKENTIVSSYTHSVEFGIEPVLIGERINPTGKKRFKQALIENDIEYILHEAINQQDAGVQVLDVNVGLPDIDEAAVLTEAVKEIQTVTDLPLQIDTSNARAMESALRRYNGKALINSVNGKEDSMEAIFPLAKKYGGVVIALTLDERGIPETAEGRVEIAQKILNKAAEYGIDKKDIIFDTLALTISADKYAALATLDALNYIRYQMGCNTSLGVSNISFGLPERAAINSTFFAIALEKGLSTAIMNPYSDQMMEVYYAYRALHGYDEGCAEYIAYMTNPERAEKIAKAIVTSKPVQSKEEASELAKSELQTAILKGLKEQAGRATDTMLNAIAPLDIVNNEIIPALDKVGKGYEEHTVYLPQLLMSAEAAKEAFERIKTYILKNEGKNSGSRNKGTVVVATVYGDIHDIGKNIVKLLLENYGFNVIDLGKDVPPQTIVDKVIEIKAPVVGLSALMTTTVPSMKETIDLLKEKAPWAKVVVGGAVLNQTYADEIGADKYASDAMETVRYAERRTTCQTQEK